MEFDEAAMRAAIACKRDGGSLPAATWDALIRAYLAGVVDDAQMAAFLMACTLRGLAPDETAALTAAMVASGERLPLLPGGVDKHSTGGVGDGVTLVVVPWVGTRVAVRKLSGRALGHTGGTLDKLEAVPGVATTLSRDEVLRMERSLGIVMAGQSRDLAPADKRLYALRDRTGTIAERGLITASIVSKKIASGAAAIVYDVKAGAGAFMTDPVAAEELARLLVATTERFERRAVAFVTDMDEPLGRAIGSGLELLEALDVLAPPRLARRPVVARPAPGRDRLATLAREIAATLLAVSGDERFTDPGARLRELDAAHASGEAYARAEALLRALGATGDLASLAPVGPANVVRAERGGVVHRVEPVPLGLLARDLGAREGPFAGVLLHVATGDVVVPGSPLASVHGGGAEAATTVRDAIAIADGAPPERPLVYARVGGGSPSRSIVETK